MCNFLSALALKNGDLLLHPMLDSHSDLVRYFKIPDARQGHQHFAKVELTPEDWMDVSTWKFQLDEDSAPIWWEDVAARVEADLRQRANRMILRDGEHELIVDGCWIIGGTAKIRDVRSGRIVRVQDSASIRDVRGSASIQGVWDSASIRDVGGSASIQGVRGSASIRDVGGSASIRDVGGSASIRDVRGSASIQGVWDSASIRDVGGSASI
ncbi:MAG: hypothetical protein NUW22_15665, partial [Acidobacteria bacterium]|nr:hypothetical protein [Acidobacteriota bacterium]